MPQLDLDDFTYATGALATVSGGKWTPLSGFADCGVVSNHCVTNGGAVGASVLTTWPGSLTDQYSEVKIDSDPSAGGGGPTICSDAVGTFYVLEISPGTTDVYKCVAGSFTSLASVAITWAQNDVARIGREAGLIVTRQNGVIRHSFSDTSIASGKPGIRVYSNGLAFDEYRAGDFGGVTLAVKTTVLKQAVKRASYY